MCIGHDVCRRRREGDVSSLCKASFAHILLDGGSRRQYFLSFLLPPCARLRDATMRDTSDNFMRTQENAILGEVCLGRDGLLFLKIRARKKCAKNATGPVSRIVAIRVADNEGTAKKCVDYLSESRDHVPWYIYNMYKYSLAYFQTNVYAWGCVNEYDRMSVCVCVKIREIERKNEKEGWESKKEIQSIYRNIYIYRARERVYTYACEQKSFLLQERHVFFPTIHRRIFQRDINIDTNDLKRRNKG